MSFFFEIDIDLICYMNIMIDTLCSLSLVLIAFVLGVNYIYKVLNFPKKPNTHYKMGNSFADSMKPVRWCEL